MHGEYRIEYLGTTTIAVVWGRVSCFPCLRYKVYGNGLVAVKLVEKVLMRIFTTCFELRSLCVLL